MMFIEIQNFSKHCAFITMIHAPGILIFDWHGTLVDTNDAMYGAMDDMLSGKHVGEKKT